MLCVFVIPTSRSIVESAPPTVLDVSFSSPTMVLDVSFSSPTIMVLDVSFSSPIMDDVSLFLIFRSVKLSVSMFSLIWPAFFILR